MTADRRGPDGVVVREATEVDVPGIRALFQATYGESYVYADFYDEWWLKRSIYSDDILLLVAVEESGEQDDPDGQAPPRVLGSASVVFDVGAHSDLVAEFGRLAVHPDHRGLGLGQRLMDARMAWAQERVHVGIVENRCVHPFSQRISADHGFAPVGFLPMKHSVAGRRESVALYCQHFGQALQLRRNHPRLVPEAATIAAMALRACGLAPDAIVDEESLAYPGGAPFRFDELAPEALPGLLRIERGRVRNRELFGPVRLQYGFFRLTRSKARYLVARDPESPESLAGAVGFIHEEANHGVRIFELIVRGDRVVRPLLGELVHRALRSWDVEFLQVDVSAHAARMQRTLVELGFTPAAYVPALVFDEVERLDVVKMVRLGVPLDLGDLQLVPASKDVADHVIGAIARRQVLPRVAEAVGRLALFTGLDEEQRTRLAGSCELRERAAGEALWQAGDPPDDAWIIIAGEVEVRMGQDDQVVGHIAAGDVVGEVALLTGEAHSATVVATQPVVAAVLSARDLAAMRRLRPDVALTLYRNAAIGLACKLRAMDSRHVAGATDLSDPDSAG